MTLYIIRMSQRQSFILWAMCRAVAKLVDEMLQMSTGHTFTVYINIRLMQLELCCGIFAFKSELNIKIHDQLVGPQSLGGHWGHMTDTAHTIFSCWAMFSTAKTENERNKSDKKSSNIVCVISGYLGGIRDVDSVTVKRSKGEGGSEVTVWHATTHADQILCLLCTSPLVSAGCGGPSRARLNLVLPPP